MYIVREVPYFEAFGRPPLLQQLWSLAVEEQFYVLWPLLMAGILHIFKNRQHALVLTTLALIALSSIWMAVLYSPAADPLRVYYGTDTRAAGFLTGAALSMIWSPHQAARAQVRRAVEPSGWAGLLTLAIRFYPT